VKGIYQRDELLDIERLLEGAGQRACTAPTSATNMVIRFWLYVSILPSVAKQQLSMKMSWFTVEMSWFTVVQ
jgi:hypothetical protein